jgi:hypothetical protein
MLFGLVTIIATGHSLMIDIIVSTRRLMPRPVGRHGGPGVSRTTVAMWEESTVL